MKCHHFTYGLFNGHGYVFTFTDGLNELTTQKMLDKLKSLTQDDQMLWPPQHPGGDHIISCTHIQQAKDEFNRTGTFNHTIIMQLTDYLALTNPLRILDGYFMQRPDEPPATLEPIMIK